MTALITGIIIGRDQALYLDRAIRSLAPWPVLYVDTGSKDDSVAIAHEAGAIVLHERGLSGGAGYMNWAASKADADYCIRLAPDDELRADGIETIESALIVHRPLAAEVWIEETSGLRWKTHRIWKRGQQWVGRAHEYLTADAMLIDASIQHLRGPWHAAPSEPLGIFRLLGQDLAEQPECPRWWYYIGKEWHDLGEAEKAIPFLEHRIQMEVHRAERADAYYLLSRCYASVEGKIQDAVSACAMALALNVNFAEAARWMSRMLGEPLKSKWADVADLASNDGVLFERPGTCRPCEKMVIAHA